MRHAEHLGVSLFMFQISSRKANPLKEKDGNERATEGGPWLPPLRSQNGPWFL